MTNSNVPLTPEPGVPETAPPTRMVSLLIVGVTGGVLAVNHYNAMDSGKVYLWAILLAPMLFLLGIGGLFDPRIALSIGPKGQHFPLKIKVIGGLLAVAGMLVSAYLALGFYRVQDIRTSESPEIRSLPDSGR